ncbi:hypothetical protein CMI39_01140 [Candidatus Pacearchaeota archaeon]|jgi:hypothetical protein|nr:hypothetical protein [Candidatus Pacearchaeota archaeon]|tara:strand:+ start:3977 stop:4654 length:678 start_codon:yes stop_codon:yes gene_type:complete
MKTIIFDASTLISLSMNGLFFEIRKLREIFNGKFIITNEVKKEIIDKPLTTKRFELEGLKLKQLLDEKVLELPLSLGINEKEISKKTNEIINIANSTFIGRGKEIHIIDSGEASCLALSEILNYKKIKNVIAIDERTTRTLGEKPENLERLLQRKLHTKINSKKENFKFFNGFRFIRSAELVYIIYKKNLIKLKSTALLDALLYAVKFKGCSISDREISEIKKIG